jgi:hypothetical protein
VRSYLLRGRYVSGPDHYGSGVKGNAGEPLFMVHVRRAAVVNSCELSGITKLMKSGYF